MAATRIRDSFTETFRLFQSNIMMMPTAGRVVAIIAISLVGMVLFSVVVRVLVWWISTAQHIDRIEPRIAQTLGFTEARVDIVAALEEREGLLAELAYSTDGDSGRNGAIMQQELRRLSSQSGLVLIGSEVQDSESVGDLDKLSVNLKVSGAPGALMELINQIQASRPVQFIDTLNISARRQLSGRLRDSKQATEHVLIADLQVSAYEVPGQL